MFAHCNSAYVSFCYLTTNQWQQSMQIKQTRYGDAMPEEHKRWRFKRPFQPLRISFFPNMPSHRLNSLGWYFSVCWVSVEIGKAPRQQNSAASSLFPQTREHAVRRTLMKRCHRRSAIPSVPALSLDANGGGPGPDYRCHCHGFISKVH